MHESSVPLGLVRFSGNQVNLNVFMKEGWGEGGSRKTELGGVGYAGYLGFCPFLNSHTHTLHFGKLTEAMNNLPIHFYIYTLNMIENE